MIWGGRGGYGRNFLNEPFSRNRFQVIIFFQEGFSYLCHPFLNAVNEVEEGRHFSRDFFPNEWPSKFFS